MALRSFTKENIFLRSSVIAAEGVMSVSPAHAGGIEPHSIAWWIDLSCSGFIIRMVLLLPYTYSDIRLSWPMKN